MYWMLLPLKHYAKFSGRSRRKEFWMFTLFSSLLLVAWVMVVEGVAGLAEPLNPESTEVVLLTGMLIILIPSIALQVRRFHDLDKSGWFVLLGIIPYVGGLILLAYMCVEGTRAENRFGPDSKDSDDETAG